MVEDSFGIGGWIRRWSDSLTRTASRVRLGTILSSVGVWLIIGFLFVPIAVVVLFAFQGSSRLGLPFDGPSTRWFGAAFRDEVVQGSLVASARVGFGAAIAAMAVGLVTAYGVSRFRTRLASAVMPLALAPILLPQLFVGLSILMFISSVGLRPSLTAVTLAHLIYVFPYVLLVVSGRLATFDIAIEDAARDLGANEWLVFWKVTFPMVRTVLAAGGVLAFALSFDEFPIALFLVGSDSTLPIVIWSRLRRVIDPTVNALATSVVAVALSSLAVAGVLVRLRARNGDVAR